MMWKSTSQKTYKDNQYNSNSNSNSNSIYSRILANARRPTGMNHISKLEKESKKRMLTVKTSCMVKPAEPTPDVHLRLSECDQIAPLTHAPLVYFYNQISDSSAFETLKTSLSQALVPFFPLAGRLLWIKGTNRLQLHCNEMGALLLEAESEAQIADFGDFRPTPEVRKLFPPIDYTTDISEQPVLLLQLTRFRCGGVSIGVGISHVLVDGFSAFLFLNSWARIARTKKFDFIHNQHPYYNRNAFYKGDPTATPRFKHEEFYQPPLLIGQHDNKEERMKETTVAMIKLSKKQVDKLKQIANQGNSSPWFSSYETLAGQIWRCACKARKHNKEQLTKVRIAVDTRKRLQAPLPTNYFGNAVVVSMPTARSIDLSSKPLNYAASIVRAGVKMVDDDYIRSTMDYLSSKLDLTPFRAPFHVLGSTMGVFSGNPNLAITSWNRIPVYDADFGWGKPIHLGPAALGFDGKFIIIPGSNEDGSYTIALRLQVAHMEDFKKLFYEDIVGVQSKL